MQHQESNYRDNQAINAETYEDCSKTELFYALEYMRDQVKRISKQVGDTENADNHVSGCTKHNPLTERRGRLLDSKVAAIIAHNEWNNPQ